MRVSFAPLLLAAAALAIPAAAHATVATASSTDYFHVTDDGQTLTFSLPATDPFATTVMDSPGTAAIYGVMVSYDGGAAVSDNLYFYDSADGGGLSDDDRYIDPFGSPLFNGPDTDPTFILGTTNLFDNGFNAPPTGSVVISSTPEPSSLILLGTGALGMAGAIRRRLRK